MTITQKSMHIALTNFFASSNHSEAIEFMMNHDIESSVGSFLDEYCSDDLRNFLYECLEKVEEEVK